MSGGRVAAISPRIERARRIRQDMGLAETRTWELLRNGRIDGLKFRRQHPVGRYTVDFACDRLRLVIELDGGVHRLDTVVLNDLHRQREIEALGWTVVRFTNEVALNDLAGITTAIRTHAAALR